MNQHTTESLADGLRKVHTAGLKRAHLSGLSNSEAQFVALIDTAKYGVHLINQATEPLSKELAEVRKKLDEERSGRVTYIWGERMTSEIIRAWADQCENMPGMQARMTHADAAKIFRLAAAQKSGDEMFGAADKAYHERHLALMDFYNVGDTDALVDAQERHIIKLQEKLASQNADSLEMANAIAHLRCCVTDAGSTAERIAAFLAAKS